MSLRELPDVERLEEEGLLRRSASDLELDGTAGISGQDKLDFQESLEVGEPSETSGCPGAS